MSSRLIKNLKTLFHTFINYKEDDESLFRQRLNENITHNNGVFISAGIGSQTCQLSYIPITQALGQIQCIINPPVEGQIVNFVTTRGVLYSSSNSMGVFRSEPFDFVNDEVVTVNVNSVESDGVTYPDFSIEFRITK